MLKVEYLHALEVNKAPCKPFWCVSVNPESGSHDQLLVGDEQVIWYQGLDPSTQTVHKVYSVGTTILQAFWCNFTEGETKSKGRVKGCGSVCIREQDCLTIYLETGAVHHVPFPFPVKKVWPLKSGLLVERLVASDNGSDGLPTIFSLLHPMDDFCPVTCRKPTPTSADLSLLGFFSEPGLQVVDVCIRGDKEPPLVLCCNSATGQHSIWSLQLATRKDIPPHLTTPQKSQSLTTPTKPLSTSAPSYHGGEVTPSGLMATPVEMILSSRKPADILKFPVLTQLQKQHGYVSGNSGSGFKSHATGRTPFMSRLETPAPEAAKFLKKCVSLSPPTLARMSPFSQIVDSRSWCTFYSEEMSFGSSFEPLLPQICLHFLWNSKKSSSEEHEQRAASMLHTCDLMGLCYVGVVVPSLNQITMLTTSSDDATKGKPPSFGSEVTVLSGSEAIALPSLSMLLVLDLTQTSLILYSGVVKMCCVDWQSLPLASSLTNPQLGISDPLENTFTLSVRAGGRARCCLPPLTSDHTVELCLAALKELLPLNIATALLSSYYTSSSSSSSSSSTSSSTSSSPSSSSPSSSSSSCQPVCRHFFHWVLHCLGLEISHMGPKETVVCTNWNKVHHFMDSNIFNRVPALKLFETDPRTGRTHGPSAVSGTQPVVSLRAYTREVAMAFHLVYEELKLYRVHSTELQELAQFLFQITSSLGWQLYVDHYQRDFPHLFLIPPQEYVGMMEEDSVHPSFPSSPPHVFQWLCCKLRGDQPPPFPVLHVSNRTLQVIKLYSLLTSNGENMDTSSIVTPLGKPLSKNIWPGLKPETLPEHRVVLCLIEEELSMLDLESFPVGVTLPIFDCIRRCSEAPSSSWSSVTYDLIGRADISKTLGGVSKSTTPTLQIRDDTNSDGMNLDLEILRLRFPHDLRVNEVRRLLQSAEPVCISLPQNPEVSDHDFIQLQETRLLIICQRTMALPVGRGMFTLWTTHPVPTSPLYIPQLNLSGRAPPQNSSVGMDHINKPPDMAQWAEFHNGVAAGLCLAPSSSKLDSAWIVFNQPGEQESANVYAGFLMALGLTGHLASLPDYDLYGYLQDKHELTVVGLLLGVAASNYGKMSPSLVSLLSLHFPPLLPPGAADIEISHTIQTAALLGIGLLYLASANRHIAEVVLREIGHSPGPELEFAENREGYSLAAGLALGMIILGLGGREQPGLDDLHLLDQLLHLMNGGLKKEITSRAEPGPSHLVLEGEMINTHVTAPGAIIALGLMYLKTNDRIVAAMLDPPQTHYDLDCIRPDFLLLRALSRGLIMWNTIQPSQEWINQHIPSVVMEHMTMGSEVRQEGVEHTTIDSQTLHQAYFFITAGTAFAMGLRFAGSCDDKPYKCLLQISRDLLSAMKSSRVEEAGKHCLEQCLISVVLALAMVMSGSGDLEVLRLIRRLRVRVRVGQAEVTYGSHMAVHMALGLLFLGGGRYTLSTSNLAVASLVCALYPVFPMNSRDNRYHLQALRHLYVLAAIPGVLVTRDVDTGKHCCVSIKIHSEGKVRESVTPCLLQDWSNIRKVELASTEYWPVAINFTAGEDDRMRQALTKSGTIFVQQRFLKKEVEGSPLAMTANMFYVRGNVDLSTAPVKAAMLKFGFPKQFTSQTSSSSKFIAAALLECLEQEKMLIFSSYLHLEQTSIAILSHLSDSSLCLSRLLWQLKLAVAYSHLYSNSSSRTTPSSWNERGSPLLSHQYCHRVKMRVWQYLRENEDSHAGPLRAYFSSSSREVWSYSLQEVMLLAELLVWQDIPCPMLLHLTHQGIVASLPDVFVQLQALQAPIEATIGLMPLLQPL